jgi:ureidoacrylate peracid hydrolase
MTGFYGGFEHPRDDQAHPLPVNTSDVDMSAERTAEFSPRLQYRPRPRSAPDRDTTATICYVSRLRRPIFSKGHAMPSSPVAGYQAPEVRTGAVILPARPEPIRIVPVETAVIVVDIQNAYASPGGYTSLAGFDVSGAPAAIAATRQVLDAAREAGILVIYFQNGWDPKYVEAGTPASPNWHKSNALKKMRDCPELHGKLLAKGGWDYAIVDELPPLPGDIVVPKTRYSGFFNTNIDSLLRSRGIRTLVFTGIATNVCVESSLRDAFHLEYFAVVLEDAVNHAGPDFVREASLYNIEKFFGWVSTSQDFRRAIAQAAPA